MKSARISCVCWLVCLLAYFGLSAQYNFRPYVINEDRTDSVQFEYKVSDFATHAVFRIDNEYYSMYDDGTHGDRIANDRIFTVTLDPQRFISTMSDDDAFRPLAGTVMSYMGGLPSALTDVYAPVRTSAMPDVPIASETEDLQMSPSIINIRSATLLSYQHIFRELRLQGISREADFLTIVCIPSKSAMTTYESLRNDVSGIGLPIYDFINDPVVSTKFKGVLTMPLSTNFDGASRNVLRYYAKQWLPYLGNPYNTCEQWSVSDLARSVIGYDADGVPPCIPKEMDHMIVPIAGTDQYSFVYAPQDVLYFNNLETYLMGLTPPYEVDPFRVFSDQTAALAALRTNPTSYRGSADVYGIDDIISTFGERSPMAGESPNDFRIYTVVLSPELLTRDEMAYFDFMAERGEGDAIVYTREGEVKQLGIPFEGATNNAGSFLWKVHALVFPQLTVEEVFCQSETFVFGGVEYTEPGVYTQILPREDGKDTVATLILNWVPGSEIFIEDEICFGDTYNFNGTIIDAAGMYYDTIENAEGCDSFITLELSVMPEDGSELYVEMCPGEEFEFAGEVLTEPGVYTEVLPNVFGCDSTIVLTLDVDLDIDGGQISAFGDQEYFTVCIGDGIPDEFNFTTSTGQSEYAFVITDQYDNVVDILPGAFIDFESSDPDPDLVRGVAYSGELLLKPGDNLFTTEISDICYSISENFLEVHKQTEGLYCSMFEEQPFNRDVDFTVAPNPTSDQLNITLRTLGDVPLDGTLEIIGVNGATMLSNRVGIYPGTNTWVIDVGNFAPGMYIAQIPETKAVIRFVKI